MSWYLMAPVYTGGTPPADTFIIFNSDGDHFLNSDGNDILNSDG